MQYQLHGQTQSKKGLYLISALAVVACVAGVFAAYQYHTTTTESLVYTAGDLNPQSMQDLWNQWKKAQNKLYGTTDEDTHRFGVFQENYLFILNWNSQNHTSTVGLNQFADLTNTEFKALVQCFNAPKNMTIREAVIFNDTEVPSVVDWRQNGVVTPVKNQGQCGSCWSFSTTGALEGIYALNTGNLLSFSEQQLVDCSGSYGNNGCNGGVMQDAFSYTNAYGIEQEGTYPYQAVQGSCQYNQGQTVFQNGGYQNVAAQNEQQLQQAVAGQPVSVAIEADQSSFQLYTGGIYNDAGCGTSLDHGVLVVGYGYDDVSGLDYWIVKNSWGQSWGTQGGFIYLSRGVQGAAGTCGVAMDPSFPTY